MNDYTNIEFNLKFNNIVLNNFENRQISLNWLVKFCIIILLYITHSNIKEKSLYLHNNIKNIHNFPKDD